MNVKKIVGFLAIAFLLFVVITQPTVAANTVTNILGVLRDAAVSVSTFIQSLFV